MFLLASDGHTAWPVSQIKKIEAKVFVTDPPTHLLQIEMVDGTFLTPKEQWEDHLPAVAVLNTIFALSQRPLVVETQKGGE